jgi:deazaflavin-dependent oxidoreductase (nitroreductase family)
MGVLQELEYDVRTANGFQRAMQRVAAWGPVSKVFQKTLHVVDRPLYRWTKGRLTVPGLVAGLPVLLLTTTGAKSGLPRPTPLLGVPIGDDIAVIGSNFGTARTPGWVVNLEADPHATVQWRDRTVDVIARAASSEETERAFEIGAVFYSGFPTYRERAAHREIRVFVLERGLPAGGAGSPDDPRGVER